MYINFDLKENKYKNIILNAKKFSNFRQRCKEFLKNNGINHDKFTDFNKFRISAPSC